MERSQRYCVGVPIGSLAGMASKGLLLAGAIGRVAAGVAGGRALLSWRVVRGERTSHLSKQTYG